MPPVKDGTTRIDRTAEMASNGPERRIVVYNYRMGITV